MTKKDLINILAAIDDDDQVRLTSETGYGYEYQVEVDSVECGVESGSICSRFVLYRGEV